MCISRILVIVGMVLLLTAQSEALRITGGFARALGQSVLGGALLLGSPSHTLADSKVYFGVGCFWHVQHEFVDAERRILNRGDREITSTTGYAGGRTTGKDGAVCYHNLQGKGDYGENGHGEVVSMSIPDANVKDFAKEYFKLFGSDGDRTDKGDRGPEYRSLLGLPGGVRSPLFASVKEAADAKGVTVIEGKGNDPDTLREHSVYVMDSNEFPFRQAEVYHQFHDGFMPGEGYPESYNSLAKKALNEGRISKTGCPDI